VQPNKLVVLLNACLQHKQGTRAIGGKVHTN